MLTLQLHKLLEPVDLLVFAADLNGSFLYANPYSEKLLGYTPVELPGKCLFSITHKEHHKKIRDYLDQIKLECTVQELECPIQNKEGGILFSLWSIKWDAADKLYYGSIKDITEQKIKTDLQELQQQRPPDKSQQADEMLERITDGFYALDEEWRITYANSQAERILNLNREDYINRVIWECFPQLNGSVFDKEYHKAQKDKTPVHFKYYFEFFDSWYDIHVYPSSSGLSIFFQDISEQVKVETERRGLATKIHQQQEQLISVLERVKDGFTLMDRDWMITYWNQEAEQIMRKTRLEVVGMNVWEAFPHLAGTRFQKECFWAIEHQIPIQFINYDQGLNIWFDNRIYPSINGVSIFFQDITEQKKAEQERKEYERKIKEQNKQLINVLEQINQAFFSLDKDFKITYWNEKAEKFYGVSRENIIGEYVRNLYNEEAQTFYRPFLQKALQEQISIHMDCICPQVGRWNEINIYPKEDGLSIFFKDINERKETEEELHKLSLIAKETTNPVWLMDKNRKITWINEAFTKVWGYTPDEAIGRTTKYLLRGPESDLGVVAQLYKAQDEGKEFRGEIISYTKSREKLDVQVICQPLFDESGSISHYFSLQIDLTERKKLDAELKAQQRRINAAVIAAQEGERAQLGQELHDNVNQVLTTVKLYTELCRDGIGNTQEITNKSVKLLQESINEIRSLSKRLSAPSLGNIRLKDSIKELVDSVAATNKVSVSLETTGIDFIQVDQEVHLGIYRIIQEHLTNILKHAEARNVQILVRVANSELELEITDDGKGFDTKKKRRGIGITNMTTRAEALNGRFDIISKPGHGCKLFVSLPITT